MRVGKSKIGRFFLFIGLILLVVFFAINQAEHPQYGYFCFGVVFSLLGGMLLVRGQQPPAESMRFRTLRRWRDQQRARKADRDNKPDEH